MMLWCIPAFLLWLAAFGLLLAILRVGAQSDADAERDDHE
jgi:hypothetical protein